MPSASRSISSHSSSRATSAVARRLAAEARHAAAILQLEEEKEARLLKLRVEAQNRALAAELAAIDSSSSHTSTNRSVNSWVHRLPANAPAMENPASTRPPIPKAVGPIVELNPNAGVPSPSLAIPITRSSHADVPAATQRPVPESQGYIPPIPPTLPSSSRHCHADIKDLAQAIISIGHKPKVCDLPLFSGKATDWLLFKQTYLHTRKSFSSFENLARIRTALRGESAQAVSALAFTSSDPDELLQALEDRFARPEFIVLEELTAVRALPKLQSDYKDLNLIACRVQNLVAILKQLNSSEYLYSPELYNTLLGKLTPLLRSLWIRYAAEHSSRYTKLEMLANFLRVEARNHTQFGLHLQIPSDHVVKHRRVDFCNTARTSFNSGVCGFCSGKHNLADCTKFKNISPSERIVFVKNSKICFYCLGDVRHYWRKCKLQRCVIDGCQYFHHKLLHGADMSKSETSTSHQKVCNTNTSKLQTLFEKPLPSVPENTSSYSCSHEQQHQKVFLKVLPVTISGPLGEIETLALLDDGSTATFIDADVASRLGLRGPEGHIQVQGVGGMIRQDKTFYVDFKIKGKYTQETYSIENARTIKNLNLSKQAVPFCDISKYPHLANIAHEVAFDEGAPTVLIGAGDWHLTITREIKAGTRNQPVATRTLLGWVVHGGANSKTKPIDFVNHAVLDEPSLESLDSLVRESFKIDALGISKHPQSFGSQHQRAIRILDDTVRRLPNGQFEVGMPWKEDEPIIPDSYPLALNRLISLEKKMAKDAKFADAYRQNVNGMILKGYAEECEDIHSSLASGSKRKIRVVHDAAAKTNGVSLNSLLLTGPDLLQSLLGILLRWREGKVALLADIKEMFPQVKIREADRDMQRFLWRDGDRRAPVKEFRMSSMIFGAASSPCTAIHLLNKNAREYSNLYPEASVEVQKNTYMDDYVSSVACVEKAASLARDIVDLHKLAHFEMRGWISNHPEALKLLPDDLLAAPHTPEVPAMAEAGANSGITWSFQPPAAPHMSGVWERLVRTVKSALHAMLRDRAPKEELLHTALLESEAIINSRPLTSLPVDPDCPEALTPFHFILGTSSPFHPVPLDVDDGDLLSRSDWRKSQRLADMFWSRWVKEYLPTLLPRGSSAKFQRSVAVGDLVLIVDPALPRGTWPRGRISRVFPGRDGNIRVAEVSTTGGSLRRPLTKLIQLSMPT
ncbi:hypothetical protein ABMA27_001700 [Loxostege sticticalis]|uniref:DUF5641 domain-containing protein n=1 Tax=Loxostege sticticalis TaxID=481309 RepID=A0ABR3HZK0_LOXSC